MDGVSRGHVSPFVEFEVGVELGRLGIAKEDLERRGVSVDDLDQEVIRGFVQRRQGPIATIAGETLGRTGLA